MRHWEVEGCKQGGPSPRKKGFGGPESTGLLPTRHSPHLMASNHQGSLSWVPRFPEASTVQPLPGRTGYKIILFPGSKEALQRFRNRNLCFQEE